MLGRSEFTLRQGFAAQNACTAQKRRFFGSSGQRVEQGASEARKRPGGAFVARCACRGAVVPRASLVARSIKHHNEGCGAFSFTLPLVGECSAVGAARGKGGVLFRKREHPLYIPQRKAYIAGLALEELHALRNQLRCTWLRHEPLRFDPSINRAHSVARE